MYGSLISLRKEQNFVVPHILDNVGSFDKSVISFVTVSNFRNKGHKDYKWKLYNTKDIKSLHVELSRNCCQLELATTSGYKINKTFSQKNTTSG